jgi:AcrR family transcriptional regulator
LRRPRKAGRAYASPLRAEQAAETRRRIVQAYGDEVCSLEDGDVTVQNVAARAGVSVPTVYRNFASLDVLGDAFWDSVETQFGSLDTIKSADDLGPYTERLFKQFEGAPVLRAMLWTRAGRRLRNRTVHRRNETFLRALAPLTKRMPEREARAVTAMIKVISSGHVWELLHGDWGLSGGEAGQAASWALGALVEALRKDPTPFKARKG